MTLNFWDFADKHWGWIVGLTLFAMLLLDNGYTNWINTRGRK